MPDPDPGSNGATETEPRPSLRDVAEQAWEDVVENAPDEDTSQVDDQGQPRDAYGRFVKAGEAEPTAPSPDETTDDHAPSEGEPAHPAATPASSNEPPRHWSAADREMFANAPPDMQAWALRRHSEMERDYQQKAQASATAVQFTNALGGVFADPVIAGSLRQTGTSPFDAIIHWAQFHKRAMDPNPQVRFGLLQELTQRMGLDPAAIGQMSQPSIPGLNEEEAKDPAIRFMADYLGRTSNEVTQLRNQLLSMQQQATDRQNAETLRTTRWAIDQFADEKDQQGRPLRPDFDTVLPALIEMYRLNPGMDMAQAYEEARWRTKAVREGLLTAARNQASHQQANQRARQAVRSNVRGLTSPVSKPEAQADGSQGLRATLEQAADEVGW